VNAQSVGCVFEEEDTLVAAFEKTVGG